jgi:hypothetical protein
MGECPVTAALPSLVFVAALFIAFTLRGYRLRRRDRARELAAFRRTITELGLRLSFRSWQRDMEACARRRAERDAAEWKAIAQAQLERLVTEKERASLRPLEVVISVEPELIREAVDMTLWEMEAGK